MHRVYGMHCRLTFLWRRSVHREWKHCSWHLYDISIPPPSFKPVSLSLSRISSILKQPKQVFFNPYKYIWLFYTLYYCFLIYFFRLTSKYFYRYKSVQGTRSEDIDPLMSPMYEHLRSNLPKEIMSCTFCWWFCFLLWFCCCLFHVYITTCHSNRTTT